MPQELKIIKVLNGHIVHAGCQILAFNDPNRLIGELGAWILDPGPVEDKYRKMHEEQRSKECPAPEAAQPTPAYASEAPPTAIAPAPPPGYNERIRR